MLLLVRLSSLSLAGTAAIAIAAYAYRRARQTRWTPPGGRVVKTSSLSVRLLGDTGPPILLLHGLVASGLYWGGIYDQLAEHNRLLVPDLLGFGRSPRPASGYGPDDHAEAVIACLDALDITEPVVIGAHSLGCLIALRLAVVHPERVAAIVAFGPPLYPGTAAARAHITAASPIGRLFVLPGRVAQAACKWMCNHRTLAARLVVLTHPGLPPEIAADGVQHIWASYSQTIQQLILAAQAQTWLDRISCPVHLVAGSHDPVVDHGYLRQLPTRHPAIKLTEWPGRHDLPLSQPAGCVTLIAAAANSTV